MAGWTWNYDEWCAALMGAAAKPGAEEQRMLVGQKAETGSLNAIEERDLQELYAPLSKALLGRVMNRRREFKGHIDGADHLNDLCRDAKIVLDGLYRVMNVDAQLGSFHRQPTLYSENGKLAPRGASCQLPCLMCSWWSRNCQTFSGS